MKRTIITAVVAGLASGCSTLAPHNNWTPTTTLECHAADAGQSPTPRERACSSAGQVESRALYYGQRSQDIANEATGFNILTIAGLVATGGFAVFDAHEDNIKAAAFLGATGSGLNQALSPAKRVEVYQLAYDRSSCVLFSSRIFLRTGADTAYLVGQQAIVHLVKKIEDEKATLKDTLLQQQVASLRATGAVLQVSDANLADIARLSGPELELAKLKLDALVVILNDDIRKGEAALATARGGLGAIVRAPDLMVDQIGAIEVDARNGINAIKIDVSKVLDLVTADFEANVKAAKDLADKAAGVGQSQAPEFDPLPVPDTLAKAIAVIESLGLKAYSDASAQLSACAMQKPAGAANVAAS
jgi:hypothetical protein